MPGPMGVCSFSIPSGFAGSEYNIELKTISETKVEHDDFSEAFDELYSSSDNDYVTDPDQAQNVKACVSLNTGDKQGFLAKLIHFLSPLFANVKKSDLVEDLNNLTKADSYSDCDAAMSKLNHKSDLTEPLFYWRMFQDGNKSTIRACIKLKTANGEEEMAISKPFACTPASNIRVGEEFKKLRADFEEEWLNGCSTAVKDKAGKYLEVIALTPEYAYSDRMLAMSDLLKHVNSNSKDNKNVSYSEMFEVKNTMIGDKSAEMISIRHGSSCQRVTNKMIPCEVKESYSEIALEVLGDIATENSKFRAAEFMDREGSIDKLEAPMSQAESKEFLRKLVIPLGAIRG